MTFQLMLNNRRRVVWEGESGEDAARRYVDCHREATVIAWRTWPRWGLYGSLDRLPRIVEPGEVGWKGA